MSFSRIELSGNLKLWDCVQDFLMKLISRSVAFRGMQGNVLNEF